MDLRDLRTLIAIADAGSFAAAGEVLGLTQSAISVRVKALENELGVTLFDRSRRPLALSIQGATLVEKAREIVDLCASLADPTGHDSISGVLHLGTIPTVLTSILPGALRTLKDKHPDLLFRLSSGLSIDLLRRVRNGDLDVAIVAEPARIYTGLKWQPFAREELVVVAPSDTPFRDDMDLLHSLPFIRFHRSANVGRLIDSRLRERGIKLRTSMEIDTLEGIALMVAHGLGVSIVPRRKVDKILFDSLTVVPFCSPPLERTIGIAEKLDSSKSHLAKLLFECLVQRFDDSLERYGSGTPLHPP